MPSFIPVVRHWREGCGRWCTPGTCGVGVCVCAATGKVYEYNTRTHERRWLESPPGYNVWTARRHSPLSVNTTPPLTSVCEHHAATHLCLRTPRRHSPLSVNTTPPLTSVCEHHALTRYNMWYLDSLQHVIPWLPTICDTLTPYNMWYLDSLQYVIPWLPTICDTLTPYNMWYLDSLQHLVLWLTTTCETHILTHYNMWNTHLDSLQHVKHTPWLTTTCETHTLTHYNMWNAHRDSLQHVKLTTSLTTTMSNSHLDSLQHVKLTPQLP